MAHSAPTTYAGAEGQKLEDAQEAEVLRVQRLQPLGEAEQHV